MIGSFATSLEPAAAFAPPQRRPAASWENFQKSAQKAAEDTPHNALALGVKLATVGRNSGFRLCTL